MKEIGGKIRRYREPERDRGRERERERERNKETKRDIVRVKRSWLLKRELMVIIIIITRTLTLRNAFSTVSI